MMVIFSVSAGDCGGKLATLWNATDCLAEVCMMVRSIIHSDDL